MNNNIYLNDYEQKIQGKAKYTTDLYFPEMLYGVIYRSPISSGTIKNVDYSKAKNSKGVISLINYKDVPNHRNGLVVSDQRIFANSDLSYVGEPVAAIAADTIENAYDAIEKISIDIDEKIPVTDVIEAEKINSPCVHKDWDKFDAPEYIYRDKNIVGKMVYEDKGVDEAFSKCDLIVENTFESGRQYQAYLEPKGVVAEYDNNKFVVHVSHQFPFNLRERLAKTLKVLPTSIQIKGYHIGGGFGAKLDMSIEPYACLLSKITKHPIKIIQSREEDFLTCPSRENAIVKIKSGLNKNGIIVATDLTVYMDSGAAATSTPYLNSIPIYTTNVPYKSGKTRVIAKSIYTNTAPTGSFRGVSGTYLNFAIERQMDEISNIIKIDRYELRLKNLVKENDTFLNKQKLINPHNLKKGFEIIEPIYNRKKNKNIDDYLFGFGIASCVWLTNPLPGSATVKINDDETISLITAATENGSGAVSIGLRKIIANEFDVNPNNINITFPDTDVCAYDAGSQGSRTTHVVGNAIKKATNNIKDKIISAASTYFESSPDDIVFKEGHVLVNGSPNLKISLSTIANYYSQKYGPLVETGAYVTPVPDHDPNCASGFMFTTFPTHTYHVHYAEVNVNKLTGHVSLLKYIVVQEVGEIIDKQSIIGQINGGVAQGIGHVLYENIDIDKLGNYIQNTIEYHIPLADEIPIIECNLLEDQKSKNMISAKGVAEPPIVPVAAVIANAVSNALGENVKKYPLKPEEILNIINKKTVISF